MKRAEIIDGLNELERSHASDKDGGYELVRDLVVTAAKLDPQDKELLRAELLSLVESAARHGHQRMWGCALDALTEVWPGDIAPDLLAMMSTTERTLEWEQQILFSLVMLKHAPVAERAVQFAERRIARGDVSVLSIAAALIRLEPEQSVSLLSSLFLGAALRGRSWNRKACVQGVLAHYLKCDSNAVVILVKSIMRADPIVGREVAEDVIEYLNLRFVKEECPYVNIDSLREALASLLRPAQ